MQRVYIGTRTLQGALERYAKKFNLLEVRTEPEVPLASRTLRRWRKSVPPSFVFSVVLPNVVTELRPSAAADRALQQTLEIATILESPVMLISHPVSVTPTAANRKRLEELVQRIPHDVVRLAWEPPGLWEEEEARNVASRLGLVLVRDAAREPLAPGSVAYTRLRGLGDSRRLSQTRIDKTIERLQAFREAFVIVETDSPLAVAKAIHASEGSGTSHLENSACRVCFACGRRGAGMTSRAAIALGSEPSMTESARMVLAKGGTSVDACITGFFTAAGAHPGVLLGCVSLLVAGTGVGEHLFDGSVVQPGVGAPRPRGFQQDDLIPVSARIPVAATGAMLSAVHAYGGSIPMSELATPGVRLAQAARAAGRAHLLRRVGDAGPVALRESSFVRALLEIGGRHEGGNVTQQDLADVQASILEPCRMQGVIHASAEPFAGDVPELTCLMMMASDPRGVLAVMHCAFDPQGPEVAPHQVTVSRLAVPVRRGIPRVRPGSPIRLPIPIALLMEGRTPWAAVGIHKVEAVDWQIVMDRVKADLSLEQSLRAALVDNHPERRVFAIVRATGSGAPRASEIK